MCSGGLESPRATLLALCLCEHMVYNLSGCSDTHCIGMHHRLSYYPRPCVLSNAGGRGQQWPHRRQQLAISLHHWLQSSDLAFDSPTRSAIHHTEILCEDSKEGIVATAAWSTAAWPAAESECICRAYTNRDDVILHLRMGSRKTAPAATSITQLSNPPQLLPLPL